MLKKKPVGVIHTLSYWRLEKVRAPGLVVRRLASLHALRLSFESPSRQNLLGGLRLKGGVAGRDPRCVPKPQTHRHPLSIRILFTGSAIADN